MLTIRRTVHRAGEGLVTLPTKTRKSTRTVPLPPVPPQVVMEIVGHSTLEMTMHVYGHVSLDAQRKAVGPLGALLDEDED